MRYKLTRIILMISILALVSLACGSFFGGGNDAEDSGKTSQEAADIETQEEEIEAEVPASDTVLGKKYSSKEGGFSFSTISGYSVEEFFGFVTMLAPGADADVGPVVLLTGGVNEEDIDLDALYDSMAVAMDESIQISGRTNTDVAGVPAISVDISGENENGEMAEGRMVVAAVSSTQQFALMASAPAGRWQELAPLVEAVLASVEFFEPQPVALSSDETESETGPSLEEVRQWANMAKASSQYGSQNWAAYQATGEPDTPACGDTGTAWASASASSMDWIELSYYGAVTPTGVNVYQSYNPSQVVKVELIDIYGEPHEIYHAAPTVQEQCPYILAIEVENAGYLSSTVKISIDQSVSGTWNEIDAVELVGLVEPGTSTSSGTTTSSSDYAAYIYNPADIGAGDFYFELSGTVTDNEIESGYMQDLSGENEYAIGLISQDGKYMLTLYIPGDTGGEDIALEEYQPAADDKAPSASLLIDSELYYASSGTMKIEVDESSHTFSGSFSLMAYDQNNTDNYIYVDGAFNQFILEME